MQDRDSEDKHKGQISNHVSILKNICYAKQQRRICRRTWIYCQLLEVATQVKTPANARGLLTQIKKVAPPPTHVTLACQQLARTFQVDLTRDPETAHLNHFMSKDKKGVISRTVTPNCLHNPGICFMPSCPEF